MRNNDTRWITIPDETKGGSIVDDHGAARDPAAPPASAAVNPIRPAVGQADAGTPGAPPEQPADLTSPELGYS